MSQQPPRRRSRRSRTHNSKFITRAQMKRENHLFENGQRFNPSIHPPDFMASPWFNLIVRIENFTAIVHTATEVSGLASVPVRIKSQLNLPDEVLIEFRIQNVRIWGPIVPMNSSSALSNLRAQFYSLVPLAGTTTGTSFAILEDIAAYPDQVSRASLGFTYPKAQQSIALQQNTNGYICLLVSGGGAGNVAYLKVLWRPRPPFNTVAQLPLLDHPSDDNGHQTDDDNEGYLTSFDKL